MVNENIEKQKLKRNVTMGLGLAAILYFISHCVGCTPKALEKILYSDDKGIEINGIDRDHNGIYEIQEYYQIVKDRKYLRYTLYDWNQDGKPDLLILGERLQKKNWYRLK